MDKNYFKINNIEIRVADGGESLIIAGFLPTNQLSHTLFDKNRKEFFREKIKYGAFASAIKEKTPLLLLNHSYKDELKVISFEWSEGTRGLRFESEILPNDELIKAIDNGSINGLSFGFIIKEQTWAKVNNELIRTVISFKELIEISILTGSNSPAYPQTTAFVSDSRKVIMEKEIKHLKHTINMLRLKEMKSHIEKLKKGCRN